MTAIITRLTEEPVGASVASLPFMLPSVGLADYAHRWSVKSIDPGIENGTKIPSWVSSRGKALSAPSEVEAPSVGVSGGMRALTFDGVNDFLSGTDLGNVFGVTLIARVTAASGVNTPIWDAGDAKTGVVRNASNAGGLFYKDGSATMTGAGLPSWAFIHGWFGTTGFLQINTDVSGAVTPAEGPGPLDAVRIGRLGNVFGAVAVAEVILWDRILNGTEIGTLRTALKAAYPSVA